MSPYFMSLYLMPLMTLVLWLGPASGQLLAEDSSFKDEVQTTVSDTVNASKDFFSGLMAGINEATGGQPDFDPSKIVGTKADLAKLLKVEVFPPIDLKNGNWLLTVALRNGGNAPVKVTNLSALGQVLVLDKNDFAYPLPEAQIQGQDVIVLPRSAARVLFNFKGLESRPMIFRIYDTDFPIPISI